QLGGNGRAGAGLAVLPGVAEIGQHGGDAPGGGAPQRVNGDQQFHDVVVGRIGRGLDDEHILAAHVLEDFHKDFVVGKAPDIGLDQGQLHISGNGFGQGTVAVAGKNFHGGV